MTRNWKTTCLFACLLANANSHVMLRGSNNRRVPSVGRGLRLCQSGGKLVTEVQPRRISLLLRRLYHCHTVYHRLDLYTHLI